MSEKHSEYFEGILQLRNDNQDIIDTLAKEIEKRNINIAKIKKQKNGVDIYVSSQRVLRSLGLKLQAQYGGQLKVSRKLHTRNRMRSREVYRVNVLLRLPDFKKGDVIDFKGEPHEVLGMQKKVLLKNKETGRKSSVSFDDVMQ